MYAAGIVCMLLFGAFYAISLWAPHRAVPWLLVAYAIFPVALILLILAETARQSGVSDRHDPAPRATIRR
jgi:hypothetical protein